MAVRIGTSGFLYDHWRHRFYPAGARGSELEYYADRFDTVELNVTFYRMPAAATFRSWAARVPPGFEFALKASRYLTHVRRLHDPGDPVRYLMDRVGELGSHLGPILLQLPPSLQSDLPNLTRTLDAFPRGTRVAVEPRHGSWFTPELRDLLVEHDVALCLADRRGPLTPLWQTAAWTYLRFHGGRASPGSCYGERALATWATRIREVGGPNPDAYAYFNNDRHGCALRDAAWFGRRLVDDDVRVSRVPAVTDDVLGDPGRD